MAGSSAAPFMVRAMIQPLDVQEAEKRGGMDAGPCPTEPMHTVPEQEGETNERHRSAES
jgi:hypothetical protein